MTAETEWFRTIELGIRAAADKAGAKVLVGNARAQVDTEAQIVDNFVARGVDAIIISALNPTSSVPALKRAVDNGVKLVDYNTTIDSPIMTTFVGVDNTELGAQMGRYIADYVKDKMGGHAKIALITLPKYEAGRQRRPAAPTGTAQTIALFIALSFSDRLGAYENRQNQWFARCLGGKRVRASNRLKLAPCVPSRAVCSDRPRAIKARQTSR
jgi:Periplasmic binding protein domain